MIDLATLLKETAFRRCRKDNPDYYPADSQNYDDAYAEGESDGEITFARELLKKLFHWTDKEIMNKVNKED